MEGSSNARWIFVLCPERSGSTLLSVILGASLRVFAPPELHLLRHRSFDDWRLDHPRALFSLCGLTRDLGLGKDPEEVARRFQGWETEAIYRELLLRAPAGQLLVDKTPAYGRKDERLERAERLRPQYLWLIRHPLAVSSSRLERRRPKLRSMREQMSSAEYHRAALSLAWRSATKMGLRKEIARWRDVHTRIEAFLANVEAERSYALHYEDLVTQPHQEIEQLCDFLGIDVEPSMFDPQANAPKELEWGLGDESIRERAGIDAKSVDRWREELSPSSLDSETHALMARLGIADEPASLSPALA